MTARRSRYAPARLAAHALACTRDWAAAPPRGTQPQAEAALAAAVAWEAAVVALALGAPAYEAARAARAFDEAARPVRPVYVAPDAECRGYGTASYKAVAGLTADEKLAVRAGTAWILLTGARLSGGRHGTDRRVVIEIGGRYARRVNADGISRAEIEGAA